MMSVEKVEGRPFAEVLKEKRRWVLAAGYRPPTDH
jgi:hypothetical protein